ncbi:MAG: hypothetical protein R3C18_10975 [Planctomycetaceae bacterium]
MFGAAHQLSDSELIAGLERIEAWRQKYGRRVGVVAGLVTVLVVCVNVYLLMLVRKLNLNWLTEIQLFVSGFTCGFLMVVAIHVSMTKVVMSLWQPRLDRLLIACWNAIQTGNTEIDSQTSASGPGLFHSGLFCSPSDKEFVEQIRAELTRFAWEIWLAGSLIIAAVPLGIWSIQQAWNFLNAPAFPGLNWVAFYLGHVLGVPIGKAILALSAFPGQYKWMCRKQTLLVTLWSQLHPAPEVAV